MSAAEFCTAWFLESLLTELVIALVVRTRRPFYKSRPGLLLLAATLILVLVTLAIPYLPFASLVEFVAIPAKLTLVLVAITAVYVVAAEVTKRRFYRTPIRA